MADLVGKILFVVSDDGITPSSLEDIASMIKGGTDIRRISVYVDKTEAEAECKRRVEVAKIVSKIRGQEIEVLQFVSKFLEVLSLRNSQDHVAYKAASEIISALASISIDKQFNDNSRLKT